MVTQVGPIQRLGNHVGIATFGLFLAFSALWMAEGVQAQKPPDETGAKQMTIFIDNRSGDASLGDKILDALREWGAYRIVNSPDQAGLVLLISTDRDISGESRGGIGNTNGDLEANRPSVEAQKSASESSPTTKEETRTKQGFKSVYYGSWELGETKQCTTFSGQPTLLICDQSSFLEIVGNNVALGRSEDETYHLALLQVAVKSRGFVVELSDPKSKGGDSGQGSFIDVVTSNHDPWPELKAGHKMALWSCTKDKIVSCSLDGRDK